MARIFEQKDGWGCPRIICDVCEQPIIDFRNAMVAYGEPVEEDYPELSQVMHCHKDEPCQSEARRMASHLGWNGSWDEMGNHLVSIVINAGLSLDDVVDGHA